MILEVTKWVAIRKRNLWTATKFLVLFLLPVRADLPATDDVQQFSEEFSRAEIIKPTLSESGLHANDLILRYTHNGKDVTIDLKSNKNVLPKTHFMRYQLPNGTDVVQHFNTSDVNFCSYKGTIRNITSSQVAISTCRGINGVIIDGEEKYYIHSKHRTNVSDDHFLYRESDRIQNQLENSTDRFYDQELLKNGDAETISFRYERSANSAARGSYNANSDSLFVELVLVADKDVYESLDKNLSKVHSHCQDIANNVNLAFVQLNIFVVLVGVVLWNEKNEIEVSSNCNQTLDNFAEYRINVLSINHPNDNAVLLTTQQFQDSIEGAAFGYSICTHARSCAVVSVKNQIVGFVAETVAHEMGHSFGMMDDTPDCNCEGKNCIMATKNFGYPQLHWSSCSIEQLELNFRRGMTTCLRNKPVQLFTMDSRQCGNGFVEPGEQCDCGSPEFCKNTCCDANTCMLRPNAFCATGRCCDLSTCQLRTAGTVCRPIDGDCDLPEICTGESEYCPDNTFKRDTELCGDGKAYCYEGACQSHNDQCKLLWGESVKSVDQCYRLNVHGDWWGNCGFDWQASEFQNCSQEDIMCGLVQCQSSPDTTLAIGHNSTSKELTHSLIVDGKNISCDQAYVGLQIVEPGLTPNGAMCGEGKMCVSQKCLSVESLRASGIGVDCPENCNGHGVCDNKGVCHCNDGYAPPLCNSVSSEGRSAVVQQIIVGVILSIFW